MNSSPIGEYYTNKFGTIYIEYIINHLNKESIPWDELSLNPLITPKIYEKYKHLPWVNIKKNINFILKKYNNILTFINSIHTINNCSYEVYIIHILLCYHKSYKELVNFIKEHNIYSTDFNWRYYLSRNKYLTWEYLKQDLETNTTKVLDWDWNNLSKHKCITIKIFEENKDKYNFSPLFLSSNPNVTLQYVLEHPNIEWDKFGLSININMTINDYEKYYTKCFDRDYFAMNPNNSIDELKLLNIDKYLLCYNPTLTIEQIINNSDINWDLSLICRNSMHISKYNYIKQHIYNKSLIILHKLKSIYNFDIDILELILSFI